MEMGGRGRPQLCRHSQRVPGLPPFCHGQTHCPAGPSALPALGSCCGLPASPWPIDPGRMAWHSPMAPPHGTAPRHRPTALHRPWL